MTTTMQQAVPARMAELATTDGERVRISPFKVTLLVKHTEYTTLLKTENAVYVLAGSMVAVIERLARVSDK